MSNPTLMSQPLLKSPLRRISRRTDGNMAFLFGKEAEVAANRQAWFEKIGVSAGQVALLAGQHHHQLTVLNPAWLGVGITEQRDDYPDFDAVLLLEPGQLAMMLLADCLGIVIWSVAKPVAALVHAGYRGVAADLPVQTAQALCEMAGVTPESLRAWCSPALLAEYSLFDEGIHERFTATWREAYLSTSDDSRYPLRLDWVRAAVDRLESEAGIARQKITLPEADTFNNNDYFSHARSKRLGDRPEGRQAVLAGFQV